MKNETSKILLAAGVELKWVVCEVADQYFELAECAERLSATRLMLQLLPGKHPRFPRAAGMAIVQGESSFFACLYPERVNQLARDAGWEFGDLLGHAAAHELGHLLLRSSTHTPAGVMRAQWEFGDLQKLPHAGLFFLPGQLSAIPPATRRQQADTGGRPRPPRFFARADTSPQPFPIPQAGGAMRNSAALVVLGALCARAQEVPVRTMSVLVFNYARVPADILKPAMQKSKRIVESGGVALVWVGCPVIPERPALDPSCRQTPGPLTLVLHILPRGSSRLQTEPIAFGFAARPETGGFGAYACVFHDRIERLDAKISKATVLGHVIAHELGHLLLGTGRHSTDGIMKGDWRRDHLQLAAQGALRFDDSERRLILENVRRRTLAAQATASQAVPIRSSDVSNAAVAGQDEPGIGRQ